MRDRTRKPARPEGLAVALEQHMARSFPRVSANEQLCDLHAELVSLDSLVVSIAERSLGRREDPRAARAEVESLHLKLLMLSREARGVEADEARQYLAYLEGLQAMLAECG